MNIEATKVNMSRNLYKTRHSDVFSVLKQDKFSTFNKNSFKRKEVLFLSTIKKIKFQKMGVLNSLFGGKSEKKEVVKINWIPLTSENQLENLSNTTVLFKHSTRCGISTAVLNRFEKQSQELNGELDFYYLDLLNFRNISDAIAAKFQIMHQSPQMVVVKNNEMVAYASHYDILEIDLKSFVKKEN